MNGLKTAWDVLKKTFSEFSDDDCMDMSAAIAYYTVFSLPALLVLIITVTGLVVDQQQAQTRMVEEIQKVMGASAGQAAETMIANARNQVAEKGGALGFVIGIGALLFGATGAFAQLQKALNRAWEVMPDPKAAGWKDFIIKRFFSLGMILVVAFLLLVSLSLSAFLSALGDHLDRLLPGDASSVLLHAVNFGVSFGVITLLFAAMFKVLPDAVIRWRDVWVGAVVSALLFTVGKFGIGLYLGQSDPGSAFGAAGSLALILVWVYYSAVIVLLGAEFTQVWATHHGHEIEPEKGAVRMAKVTQRIEPARADRPAAVPERAPAPRSGERHGER